MNAPPSEPNPPPTPGPPRRAADVLDADFLEHRAKLLDLAAFLDRLERAEPSAPAEDPRLPALLDALQILHDGEPHRTKRILERWSDPTTDLLAAAPSTPVLGVAHPQPDTRP